MLQQKISRCNSLIEEVQANKEQKEGNEKVAKRNNRFFDAFNNFLIPILSSLKVIKSLPEFSFPEAFNINLKNYIEDTQVALTTKVIKNPEGYNSGLSKLYSEFENCWKAMTKTFNESLLDEIAILRLVQSDTIEIFQITRCINNIQNWPVREDAVKMYKAARDKGEELLSEMKFDKEIKEFLQKVRDKQASLLDLNDKILNWIKSEQFENKFLLTVR